MTVPTRSLLQRRRIGVWLAALALIIQSWLPLIDAGLHARGAASADARGHRVAGLDRTVATPAGHQQPSHPPHQCPICQFMLALGSFSPPSANADPAPTHATAVVAWSSSPRLLRPTDAWSAQARAPPALV